jgi:hypothetical protein
MSATFEPALIIAGLVLCLFGWVLYWAGLRLLGGLCGAIAATALAVIVILFGGWDRWLWLACAIAAVVGAAAGIYLITRAHYLLFFITGAVVGLASGWVIETTFTEWVQSHLPLTGALGRTLYYVVFTLAGGLLVLLAHRMVVIVLTALSGTVLFALGLPKDYAVWLFLPVFLGSLLIQTGILKALGEGKKPEAPKPGQGQPAK